MAEFIRAANLDDQGAPVIQEFQYPVALFLAGTVSPDSPDWREDISRALSDFPVTVVNPMRSDWNWEEKISCKRFCDQVNWEMTMQEKASVAIFYFAPEKDGKITLLELGTWAGRQRHAVVYCPDDYEKSGYVHLFCEHFGLKLVKSGEKALKDAVKELVQTEIDRRAIDAAIDA